MKPTGDIIESSKSKRADSVIVCACKPEQVGAQARIAHTNLPRANCIK
ncbi:hypothetical protein [uncultured Helicobacter sp.]